MKYITILTLFFSLSLLTTANAQEVTRAEFEELLQRVQVLEQKLALAQKKEIETIADEVAHHAATPQMTGNEPDMIEDVISEIQSREESINHPWMDAAKWAKIEKGMSTESVIEILGDPYTDEPSLRKRIDSVFTYTGRRSATNKKVTGIVRFYKGKVVNIESPDI